jgi:phosphopantothenoylcysteine decarboxylase / phosphopantothenate---cysteine ligase
MRILITAGPTHEPIDPVRFVGNRSSGKMGAALGWAAVRAGHPVTIIVGPVAEAMPAGARRIDVQTADEMLRAVLAEFPNHDVLIMAAAVGDFRPKTVSNEKIPRRGGLTIELEPTEDIIAAAGGAKRAGQIVVGFSLESSGGVERAKEKLLRKKLDLMVFNTPETLGGETIHPTLLWPDGRQEDLRRLSKADFADALLKQLNQIPAAPPADQTRST